MHYYKRHIGDYAKKAGHLSVLEHGVYTLLLDAYYDREQPPTRAEAVRIARCRTPDEQAALDAVLADFFHEVDGRYVQDRVEEEFKKAEAQARANQANGSLGGRPRKPKGNQQETHSVLEGKRNVSEKNPNPLIHQSTNPPKEEKATPVVPTGDERAVLEAYHAILPSCQRIAVLNPKRKRRIATAVKLARAVCREQEWVYDPEEFWIAYFTECTADPWLRGERANPNNPNWKQNLDVLLAEDRFAGIMDRAIAAMREAA